MLSITRCRLAIACVQLGVVCAVIMLLEHRKYGWKESGSITMEKPLEVNFQPETLVPVGEQVYHNKSVVNKAFRITPPPLPKKFVPMSEESIDRVRKFVFFMGWSRSGSSIIGSMLDAHPHIILSHEYALVQKWKESATRFYHRKRYLFNELYGQSYHNVAIGHRNSVEPLSTRGYSFMWQGQFKDYVAVIGNKQAEHVTRYYLDDVGNLQQLYKQLVETVGIPVVVLVAVRNPFDMVARRCIHVLSPNERNMRELRAKKVVYRDDKILTENIETVIKQAGAVHAMMQDPNLNLTVMKVHNADYVNDPKRTLQRICDLLEVECSERYLQACTSTAFKSTFKTRQLVKWPPELRALLEQEMRKFRIFDRYSFDSE